MFTKPYLCTLTLLAVAAGMSPKVSLAEDAKPNVLFIAVDDLNDWVGVLGGHPQTQTPNIDRLANRGVLFTNAHCPAPLCNASRAALMSGLRPSTTGVYGNRQPLRKVAPKVTTLPQHLRTFGYSPRRAGKIFHGRFPEPTSWDKAFPNRHENRPVDPQPDQRPINGISGAGHFDWGPVKVAEEQMGDYQVTEWIIEQIQRDHDKPFFLACGIFRPHLPWYVPPKHFTGLPSEAIQRPHTMPEDLADLSQKAVDIAHTGIRGNDHRAVTDNNQWQQAVRGYLASIRFADRQVGRVLRALKQAGHADDTIVVLWSDHGWHLGEKEAWRKFTLWERSTRVPMIIAAPGHLLHRSSKPKGVVCDRPVNLMDLYPTLCELADVPIPDHVEGRSLLPLLRDPEAGWNRPSITTFGYNNHAVRSQHLRYIRYGDGSEELYDHRRDPHEWHNLANHPAYKDEKQQLRRHLPKDDAKPAPRVNRKWWPSKGK